MESGQVIEPTPFPKIADSVIELIGNTPMMRLSKVTQGCVADVIVKLESHEPCSSVKDRLAMSMVVEAEKRGDIKPGDTLVEPTSGNTGIALAMVAASKGYKMVIVMPDTMSMERRVMIRAYGAELFLTPGAKGMPGAIALATQICEERKAVMLQQFKNMDNPKVHRETTGPEIWQQTDGKVDIFIAGVGTGGTVTGCSQYLKGLKPELKSIAVEPAESPVLSGGQKGPHKIQGIGAGFVPDTCDTSLLDEIYKCPGDEAIAMSKRLALEEGLMVGISSGAAVKAAIDVASREENKGKMVVCIIPSFGERYLSTALFAEFTEECKNMPTVEAK